MIEGLKIVPKKIIPTDSGPVYHIMKASDPDFKGFGEIYSSEIFPGKVKAWKRHSKMTCNLIVLHGEVKLVIYDSREKSPTFGKIEELYLGPGKNYSLAVVPPGLWFGFGNCTEENAILVNCAPIEHDPAESEKLPADTHEIPYKW
jgi:dTDP-4-dehydrorhamnose 3,5-epimerase